MKLLIDSQIEKGQLILFQGKRKKKDGHQDDLTATSPPSSYTPKPNYMTSEPGEAQETDHNIESFDNKNILNSDFDNSVLKENPSEATPSKLELEQYRKRQFVTGNQKPRNHRKA